MDRFGHYEVLRKLATGGMAEIYLARAHGTAGFEKLVVIKRLLPSIALNQQIVRMFLDEARLAATLHHHNIADVFDVGEDDGDYFFAMEYVYGQDARRVGQRATHLRQKIPFEIALAIGIAVASALDYAHNKTGPDGKPLRIVHRDISPSNIVISYDGAVKLVDFGIARAASRTVQTTTGGGGGPKGKVPYMSPEQCLGDDLDARSDLFSLGTVLYELTTSERPFQGYSDYDVMAAIVDEPPQPPSKLRDEYPAGLDAVVLRLLRRDRDLRYQSAREVLEDLERVVALNSVMCSALVVAKYMRNLFADSMTGANPVVRPNTLDQALAPLIMELEADAPPEPIAVEQTQEYPKGRPPTELGPEPRAFSADIEMQPGLEALEIERAPSSSMPQITIEPEDDDDLAIPPEPPSYPRITFNPVGTRANDERVTSQLERAVELIGKGELEQAIAAVELALKVDPDRPLGRHHGVVLKLYESFLGDHGRKPRVSRALSKMDGSDEQLDAKAAFLLSRIDGKLTVDEILDISGMPKFEAYRHLAQLFVRGLLRW